MTRVYLGLGSNVHRDKHISNALQALRETFGEIIISPIYENRAIGFNGAPFYNLVAGIDTGLRVSAVSQRVRSIEDANGRDRSQPRFSNRTLDIDILTYGNLAGEQDGIKLPRAEITTRAFVLKPLADIAPEWIHPKLGLSALELWLRFEDKTQHLKPVPFNTQLHPPASKAHRPTEALPVTDRQR